MRTLITSSDRSQIDFSELTRYSGLLRYLALRDVFVRYKQTWMGFGWSIVRPAVNILIFGALSYLIDRSEGFSAKFVAVSAGIVFWQLLSTAVTDVSNSLSANTSILTKVYFPKIILPVSALLVCLIDFAIAFAMFLVIFFVIEGMPPWQIVFLPLVIAHCLLFAFGTGLAAATASVRYRDVRFILPFILQILFYASPVFLSSEFVLGLDMPAAVKTLYQLNPLVFILNAFKYCFFGHFDSFDPVFAAWSVIFTLLLFLSSLRYFSRFQRSFADYI